MTTKLRLHRFLSRTGIFPSKKAILEAIHKKEVSVDSKIITDREFQIKKNADVKWKDKKLEMKRENIYIMINKPEGYLSSRLSDEDKKLGKKSVFDLIKMEKTDQQALACVGRLDEDTSGLLILTNDGQFINKIANPASNISKTYEAELEKPISDENIRKIEKGIVIELEENGKITKYTTRPSKMKKINQKSVEITITEGKKREVRRMFEAVDNKVIRLERIAIGKLRLKLKRGEYREVTRDFLIKNI